MNQIQIFNYNKSGIRFGQDPDGTPWVIGVDFGKALGHKNPERAVREYVDDEDKGVTVIVTPGGKQRAIKVYEPGIYSLIMHSQIPEAKKFKHWVFSEVLPSIRRTGSYSVVKAEELSGGQKPEVRAKSKKIRRNETDIFKRSGIEKSYEYKNLTDAEYKATFGMTAKQYREFKNLGPKENVRENFSAGESIVCQVADMTTTMLMDTERPYGYYEVKGVVTRSGNVANKFMQALEAEIKRPIVTPLNRKDFEAQAIEGKSGIFGMTMLGGNNNV